MIGCVVAWKCFVACLFFEESQHPTWPQMRQSRRWTQVSPICRHSSQPWGVRGVTSRIWSRWVHGTVMLLSLSTDKTGRPLQYRPGLGDGIAGGVGVRQGVDHHEVVDHPLVA